MKKKLQRNQTFKDDYISFMNDMINKGYAVKVPNEDLKRSDGKVWFIPHHAVYRIRRKYEWYSTVALLTKEPHSMNYYFKGLT